MKPKGSHAVARYKHWLRDQAQTMTLRAEALEQVDQIPGCDIDAGALAVAVAISRGAAKAFEDALAKVPSLNTIRKEMEQTPNETEQTPKEMDNIT